MFFQALLTVLTGLVVYLLLQKRYDGQFADAKLRAKREARARRSTLDRSIAGLDATAAKIQEQSDAADRIARQALNSAVEMSRRFDQGQKPTDGRPIYSLTALREKADERAARRKREIENRNAELARKNAEIRETEIVDTETA